MIRDIVRVPSVSGGLTLHGLADLREFPAPLGRDVKIPDTLQIYKFIEDHNGSALERYVVADRIWDLNTFLDADGNPAKIYPIAVKITNTSSTLSKAFLFVEAIRMLFEEYDMTDHSNITSIGQSIINRYGIAVKGLAMKSLTRLTPLLPDYWPGCSLERRDDREIYYRYRDGIDDTEMEDLTVRLSLPLADIDPLTRYFIDHPVIASTELKDKVSPIYVFAYFRSLMNEVCNKKWDFTPFVQCADPDPRVVGRLMSMFLFYMTSTNYTDMMLIDSGPRVGSSALPTWLDTRRYIEEDALTDLNDLCAAKWNCIFSTDGTVPIMFARDWLSRVIISIKQPVSTDTFQFDLIWWLLTSTSLINRR